MKFFLRKVFIPIILISLTACGAETDTAPAPDLSHTNPAAVKAVLEEEITGELTVTGFDRAFDRLLYEARKVFGEKYPGTKIKVDNYQPGKIFKLADVGEDGKSDIQVIELNDTENKRDYLTMINTELMSGGGPDILLIDVIPWFRYADMGYFENLRVYMEQDADFHKEDLRMNIINAVEYRGGVYAMPISFYFPSFSYDASLFNDEEKELLRAKDAFTFGELIGIAENAFERNNGKDYMFGLTGGKYFGPTGGEYKEYNIFHYLITENYAGFVDLANKRAYFDDGRFENLLLSVTEYVKKGYIQEESDINDRYKSGNFYSWYNGTPNPNPDQRFFYKYGGRMLQVFDKEFGLADESYPPTVGYDKDDVIAGLTADCNGNILFTPRYMYAINSNSKNKHAAWEFIKILLSEEIQGGADEIDAIPVYRDAFEAMEEVVELKVYGYRKSPLNDDNRHVWNAYLELKSRYVDMLNTYTHRDDRIDEWIDEEVALYFSGEKSAKDVAKALQNKVSLYLNE